jgi:heme exporter protein A
VIFSHVLYQLSYLGSTAASPRTEGARIKAWRESVQIARGRAKGYLRLSHLADRDHRAEDRLRLIVSELACERGGRALFSGVRFTVEAGRAAVLTGPNGAGKTSLLSIMAGFLKALRGEVRLEDAKGEERYLPEDAHFIGHRDGLKSQLLVSENLTFWQALLGSPWLSANEALGALGLEHVLQTPCAYLSAGQRRRVALARLLVSRRPLWLLDEPTAALDTASRALLARLMGDHLASGGLIVAATHEPLAVAAAEIRIGG